MTEEGFDISKLGSLGLHRLAEEKMGEADMADFNNNPELARSLRVQAANFEMKAFPLIPEDRIRTRNILGVSAVVLNHKGESYEAVISSGTQILEALGENAFPGTITEIQEMIVEAQVKLGSAPTSQ